MKLLENINIFLKKPFPEEESKLEVLKYNGWISFFVFIFLYTFEPFGINNIESNKLGICFGFGVCTFIAAVAYDLLITDVFKLKGSKKTWTFGKWMIYNFGVMFVISMANFLYARFLFFGYIKWELYPQMLYSSFTIGIIPLAVLGLYKLMKRERDFQHIAQEINQNGPAPKNTHTTNEALLFDIPVKQIKYVEALQNYVKIGYVNEAGQLANHTERATLKHIQKQTQGSSIIKSHRSFLVNQDAIVSYSGNAQGLLLELSDCEKMIPVSRSYVPVFRAK